MLGKDVLWTKNGTTISSYDGQVWLFEVDTHDEGEYTCSRGSQVLNYLLVVQGSYSLQFFVNSLMSLLYLISAAPPSIVNSSTVVFVEEGGTASLYCVTQGRPHPQMKWYYGNIEIGRSSASYSPLHNGTLLVYEANTELEGAYTCEAENIVGKTQVTMLLLIHKSVQV